MGNIVIIGARICGLTLAREWSKYQLNVLVLEKENNMNPQQLQ
ncbi:MAG: NAD(P)-binding protein [Brevinema sp.]